MPEIARSTDWRNPYQGWERRPEIVPSGVTKWDLLGDADREVADRTPTGPNGELVSCSGCGADVSTEGKFARHFTLPDPRYWNLGNCPNGNGPRTYPRTFEARQLTCRTPGEPGMGVTSRCGASLASESVPGYQLEER